MGLTRDGMVTISGIPVHSVDLLYDFPVRVLTEAELKQGYKVKLPSGAEEHHEYTVVNKSDGYYVVKDPNPRPKS